MNINFWRKIYYRLSKKVLRNKIIRHAEPSLIFSPDNINANDFLINLTLEAIALAWSEPIAIPNEKLDDAIFYNIFPGEHYRLLRAIAKILNPGVALEVGTYTGMGSVALMQGQQEGQLYTFDIFPWNSFQTHLTKEDFDKKKVVQIISDLSNANEFEKYINLLNEAEIIFMDAPKDGLFEYKFISLITQLNPKKKKLLVLDDIRFVNMIDLWVSIESPKIDISSFGHWSGTGLIDISDGLRVKNLT
jgi:hypothetical protein